MAHKWEFPGGKPEPGEAPEDCLKRELCEELGIVAEIGRLHSSGVSMPGSDEGIELLAYEAFYPAEDPIVQNDHEELRWVAPSDLAEYDFPEADKPIVLKLMKEAGMPIDARSNPDMEPHAEEMELNSWPVNRRALKMLKELGEKTDPASMYLLQLASWAMKTGKTEAEEDVGETVNAMTEWRPQRIMNFFLLEERDGAYNPPAGKRQRRP